MHQKDQPVTMPGPGGTRFRARVVRSIRNGLVLVLLFGILLNRSIADDAPPDAPAKAVDYMIVVTGSELLSGVYPDGHTYFLTRTLGPLGLHCVGSLSVDDRSADIRAALEFAAGRAALVIVTGGLGPTDSDITRETLSQFTGIGLREHPEVLEQMERRFQVARDQLRANLRRQAQVPQRGTYLANAGGSAVGLVFDYPAALIVALPGPPRESQPMVRQELVPYLSRRFGTREPGMSLTLRFVGLGQSQVDQTLKDHVALPRDVAVTSQFEGGRVDFTFSLPDNRPAGRERLDDIKRQILRELGDDVYAEGQTTLEQRVVQSLTSRNATLALAEVGSGGNLAAALSGTEGAEHVLAGAWVAPTEDRLRRLLRVPDRAWEEAASTGQRAARLVDAAKVESGSSATVSVGEVRQDEAGTRYVEAVFQLPGGRAESQRIQLGETGEIDRVRLTTQLLDQLRRRLK